MSLSRSSVSLDDGDRSAPTAPPGGREGGAPLVVIEARPGWKGLGLHEFWLSRELLYFLVWRDVKVRYKQTVLGVAWAVLQPAVTMILFTLVFGRLGGMGRLVQVPYPVFAYSGILLWSFFAAAVGQSSTSLVASSHLVSKVYFPRLIIPVAAVGSGLLDLAVSSLLMIGLLFGYGLPVQARAVLFPVFAGTALLSAIGVGTLLSALTVAYRDFRHLTGYLIQTWMFVSPVAYPLDAIPDRWRLLYSLNPMVGPIAGCRASLLGEAFPWGPIAVSTTASILLLLLAMAYFRSVERRFADIV